MKNLLIVLLLFGSEVFFSILSIFNVQYTGSDDSNIFVVFRVILFIFTFLYWISIVMKRRLISYKEVLIILLITIFISLIYTTIRTYNFLPNALFTSITVFGVVSIPSVLSAFIIYRKRNLNDLVKWLDVVNIVITIGLISALLSAISENSMRLSLAGRSYQIISYMSAYGYILNLFMLSYKNKLELFKFTRKKGYIFIRIISIIICSSTLLISGGRGGLVLATISTLYLIRLNKKSIKLIGIISVAFIAILITFNYWEDYKFAEFGLNRMLEFISSDGIVWEKTAGRNYIYLEALNLFSFRPFLGYGIGSSYYITSYGIYPHNFFLEVLLDGGFIYLILWIGILLYFIYKLRLSLKVDIQNKIITVFFFMGFIPLLFSYSYWYGNPLFWFSLSYMILYKIPPKKYNA